MTTLSEARALAERLREKIGPKYLDADDQVAYLPIWDIENAAALILALCDAVECAEQMARFIQCEDREETGIDNFIHAIARLREL